MKERYLYEGPVTEFGVCIANHWRGETYAISPSKAKSNLIFRFKKENNRLASAKIEFPGVIVKEA